MTATSTQYLELSAKIQAQTQDVLGSAHSINLVGGSALPPELSALFDAVLRSAARGPANLGTRTRIRADDFEKYRCVRHRLTIQSFESMEGLDHRVFN